MKVNEMWGVCYFMGHKWYGHRLYKTPDEAVGDFIKLAGKPHIGAVRLYEPGTLYAGLDAYLWHDERQTQEERRLQARRTLMAQAQALP